MRTHQLELRKLIEDARHQQPRERDGVVNMFPACSSSRSPSRNRWRGSACSRRHEGDGPAPALSPPLARAVGPELGAILDAAPASPQLVVDLLLGAVDAWLRPQSSTLSTRVSGGAVMTVQSLCDVAPGQATARDHVVAGFVTLAGTAIFTLLWLIAERSVGETPWVAALGWRSPLSSRAARLLRRLRSRCLSPRSPEHHSTTASPANAPSRSRRMSTRPGPPQPAVLPSHRFGKGAVDIQSDDAHSCSLLQGSVKDGSSRATRHLLIRARRASGKVARGGHVTSSGSQPTVYRRPARTFVLPAPRVPVGLTIRPFQKLTRRKAPHITYRITGKSSA